MRKSAELIKRALTGIVAAALVATALPSYAFAEEEIEVFETEQIEEVREVEVENAGPDANTPEVIDLQGVYQKPLWKSANNDVVFVDESGCLYGRIPGKTTLQTKIGGKTLKLNVTVEP